MMSKSHISLFILALAITALLFVQSLSGPFLYDDFSNLNQLKNIKDNESLINYITNLNILNRSLAMVTFAIQYESWPHNTAPFKIFNLILHLLNAVLILNIVRCITQKFEKNSTMCDSIAVFIAVCWMIHPLNTSTVMYVVQRMTLLSAFFSLLTVLIYLKYISRVSKKSSWKAYFIFSICIYFLVALGFISKQNALLTIPAILLLDCVFIKHISTTHRVWRFTVLIVPTISIIILLVVKSYEYFDVYLYKGFTVYERILTQSRVLISYLSQIIIPDAMTMTLYHDDFEVSSGVLNPIRTLPSVVFIIFLLIISFIKSLKWYIRLGLLWFFIWHLIESTILPLDIYFEHRNYLSSLGIFIIIGYTLSDILSKHISKDARVFMLPCILYIFFLGWGLNIVNDKWREEPKLLLHWLEQHPESRLTTYALLNYYLKQNRVELAVDIMQKINTFPVLKSDIDFNLLEYTAKCSLDRHHVNDEKNLLEISSQKNNYNSNSLSTLKSLIAHILTDKCKPIDIKNIIQLIDLITSEVNPLTKNKVWLSTTLIYKSYVLHKNNRPLEALNASIYSHKIRKSPEALINIINLSRALGLTNDLKIWLDEARRYNTHVKNKALDELISQIKKTR